MASTATAEYVVIVANLSRQASLQAQPGPVVAPPRAMQPGAPPGVPGGAAPGTPPGGAGANSPLGPAAGGGAFMPAAEAFDPDRVPLMTVAVIEVEKPISSGLLRLGQMGWVNFKVGGQDGRIYLAPTSVTQVSALRTLGSKGKIEASPPLQEIYGAKAKALKESKTPVTADQWVELAEWCLSHGMLEHFKQHMEAAAAVDKANVKAAGYLQMKAALAKPVASVDAAGNPVDTAGRWKEQLLSTRYQTRKTAHYIILQNDPPAAEARAPRMEDALQAYYYWFALHGVQLPVASEPLIAILTQNAKEFKHLHDVLDSSPVISDSFYAHRENLVVLSSKRLDDAYDRLEKMAAPLWGQGYNRDILIKGKLPRGRVSIGLLGPDPETKEAMSMALLLKVMEADAEVAGAQNGATRQLLYSSGLLPATVSAPEWVQFGVSTFFETSPGSPWPTVGMPNFTYHPLFKGLLAARKLPGDQLDLLKEVVTDGFFRNPADGLSREAATPQGTRDGLVTERFLDSQTHGRPAALLQGIEPNAARPDSRRADLMAGVRPGL